MGHPRFFWREWEQRVPSTPAAQAGFGWDDKASFQDDKLSTSHSSRGRLIGAPGHSRQNWLEEIARSAYL